MAFCPGSLYHVLFQIELNWEGKRWAAQCPFGHLSWLWSPIGTRFPWARSRHTRETQPYLVWPVHISAQPPHWWGSRWVHARGHGQGAVFAEILSNWDSDELKAVTALYVTRTCRTRPAGILTQDLLHPCLPPCTSDSLWPRVDMTDAGEQEGVHHTNLCVCQKFTFYCMWISLYVDFFKVKFYCMQVFF